MHGKDNVWLQGTNVPLSWARKALVALTCFHSHHGRPVELVDFSHDPAVFGSRLVPNTLRESQEN